jgi:hypothetical protein
MVMLAQMPPEILATRTRVLCGLDITQQIADDGRITSWLEVKDRHGAVRAALRLTGDFLTDPFLYSR